MRGGGSDYFADHDIRARPTLDECALQSRSILPPLAGRVRAQLPYNKRTSSPFSPTLEEDLIGASSSVDHHQGQEPAPGDLSTMLFQPLQGSLGCSPRLHTKQQAQHVLRFSHLTPTAFAPARRRYIAVGLAPPIEATFLAQAGWTYSIDAGLVDQVVFD